MLKSFLNAFISFGNFTNLSAEYRIILYRSNIIYAVFTIVGDFFIFLLITHFILFKKHKDS